MLFPPAFIEVCVLVPGVPPLSVVGVHDLLTVVTGEYRSIYLRRMHAGLVELQAGHIGGNIATELASWWDELKWA